MLNEVDMKDSLCPPCKRAVMECIDMDDEDMAFMSADMSLDDVQGDTDDFVIEEGD